MIIFITGIEPETVPVHDETSQKMFLLFGVLLCHQFFAGNISTAIAATPDEFRMILTHGIGILKNPESTKIRGNYKKIAISV